MAAVTAPLISCLFVSAYNVAGCFIALIGLLGSVLLVSQGLAQGTVTGVVVNRGGEPIGNVGYRFIGFPSPSSEGRILETGIPMRRQTDKEGRFVVTWPRHPLVELEFDHPAYAPVFRYKISPADSPLKVVMDKGKLLKGRILDEHGVPIEHAPVELQMPQADLWYQKPASTDENGQFHFRISEPPPGHSWMLFYAGKSFTIDYGQVGADTVLELRANLQLTLKADPGGEANRSPAIGSETNRTPSAAGARR